jgi:hypothetical protein
VSTGAAGAAAGGRRGVEVQDGVAVAHLHVMLAGAHLRVSDWMGLTSVSLRCSFSSVCRAGVRSFARVDLKAGLLVLIFRGVQSLICKLSWLTDRRGV